MYKIFDSSPKSHPDDTVLTLDRTAFLNMVATIGTRKAESGGAFGGAEGSNEVTHYTFDQSSRTTYATYTPDHEFLNRLFDEQWNPQGVRLKGFVHSHPGRNGRPSPGDEVYAERILGAISDMDRLWLPIINTIPDTGEFRITFWYARRTRRKGRGVVIESARVKLVASDTDEVPEALDGLLVESVPLDTVLEEIVIRKRPVREAKRSAKPDEVPSTETVEDEVSATPDEPAKDDSQAESGFDRGETFARVEDAYDLEAMRSSRIIFVGVGGAATYAEELARAGLEQFVLIDDDVVSETNLATQQVYRRDIGRPKVDCVAERIRDINPLAQVVSIQKKLDPYQDGTAGISDAEIEELAFGVIDGRETNRTIIAGLTDSFPAQARVARLALQFGMPSIYAQVYKEGRAAELAFTFPGVTSACHRCVLTSRYDHFLEAGGSNPVSSNGTPIFVTTRLNASKGFLTLALLHHGTDHPRWGDALTRIGERNLIQIRMDPDLATTMGLGVFDRVLEGADRERIFMDDTVWLPQGQESIEADCPDCGGTGDLRDAMGRFEDTRLIRPHTEEPEGSTD